MSAANGTRPRDSASPPADWDALGYQPGPLTPLRTCRRCGAKYLDDDPSRAAHLVVFGHRPREPEPTEGAP